MGYQRSFKSVMVVEDDPTLCQFWLRILTEMGVEEFVILSDPLDAMSRLSLENYELLISDVVMPHITGYELAKYACAKHSNIVIILTTGYTIDLSRFSLEGCRFHLLYKPYNNIDHVKRFIYHILKDEDVYEDASEDSYSENKDYPMITEWRL